MIRLILSVLSGCLLALAFPKFNLSWLAWVALVPFFLAVARTNNQKQVLACGFWFGLAFFGLHLYWITSLFDFVQWWSVLAWASLALYQTVFILIFVLVLRSVTSGEETFFPLLAAVFWVAIEWLRAWGPFGVTGGDLGYSQVKFLPVIQIAAFSQVYGVSFLIVFFNAAVAQFIFSRKKWVMLVMAVLLVVSATLYGYNVLVEGPPERDPRFGSVKLALIQPNIPQKDKLKVSLVPQTLKIYEGLTRRIAERQPDIIIWPETALFTYVLHDTKIFKQIQALAKETGAWLVFGTPHYVAEDAFNSVVVLAPDGQIKGRYDKQALVPFGEYLPFRKLLFPILKSVGYYDSEFVPGPELKLLKIKNLRVATAVCFESTFPGVIKARAAKGADFILLVTNDAWFDDSAAPYFHLNTGIFRAIENRKYFIQVGNTGITAVIDPYGRVIERTDMNLPQILMFKMPLS